MPKENGSKLLTILDAIDVFKESARFNFKGKRVLSTALGGILTICLVLFITSQISTQFVGMFNHQSPQVYQVNELEDDPVNVQLYREHNFFLAVSVVLNSASMNLTQSSPFNFKTTYNKYTLLDDGSKLKVQYPLLWAPCNHSDFPDSLYGPDAFTTIGLNYAYCASGINFTNSTDGSCPTDIQAKYPTCITPPDFEVKGDYFSEQFDFIQSYLEICDPNDPNLPYLMTCDITNISSKFLTSTYKLNLYYSYSLINPGSYAIPNSTLLDNVYWGINPQIYKIADLFVDRVTVQDFDDYVSSSSHKNKTFYSSPSDQMRDLESMTTTSTTTPKTRLMEWNIRRSSRNKVVARTYPKVTNILADLGGFSKALMFIAAMIVLGYIRFKYFTDISNELYEFRLPQTHNYTNFIPKKLHKKDPRNFLLIARNNSNSIMNGSLGSPDTPSALSPRIDDFASNACIRDFDEKLKSKQAKLSSHEGSFLKSLFHVICCRKNPEQQLGHKARALAHQDLDIVRIIRKLQQFNRLMVLLLNPKQRDAFHFIDKPLVTLGSKKPLHSDSITSPYIRSVKKTTRLDVTGEVSHLDQSQARLAQTELENKDLNSILNYGKLYVAYRYLLNDRDASNGALNKKLIGMLNPDLVKVFKRVDQLAQDEYEFEDPNPKHYENVVKQVLENQNELMMSLK